MMPGNQLRQGRSAGRAQETINPGILRIGQIDRCGLTYRSDGQSAGNRKQTLQPNLEHACLPKELDCNEMMKIL